MTDGKTIKTSIVPALIALTAGIVSLALEPSLPEISKWPSAWVLPVNDWISAGVGTMLETLKPIARFFSYLLGFPMQWANLLFNATPWPLLIGLIVALGWHVGGFSMALLSLAGFSFVLVSGYWPESMNTLALVSVSVPLAVLLGAGIGILANELPKTRPAIETFLDVMQTVPTFAYLTPLLFLLGFGPVVGLIASAIYAAPPMARNFILGLQRVDPEIREAAVMAGANRWQQLFLVEIPAASNQIMVGVNQCLMAALSMVIIAAVIGGFNDIGWEVLLSMRKAQFGQAFLAGLVIVAFAIVIDRISGTMALERRRHDRRVTYLIIAVSCVIALLAWSLLPPPGEIALLAGFSSVLDSTLSSFTAANGTTLEAFKNNAMFFGLLPLRIGLDDAVLPFTWGFQWTGAASVGLYAAAFAIAGYFAWRGKLMSGIAIVLAIGVIETGITQLPWLFVVVSGAALGYAAKGRTLALIITFLLFAILISGLWDRAMLSVYLCGAAVLACAIVGGGIGLLTAVSQSAWRIVQPICDMLQTIPLFVFLIPVLMFFQIGEFSAFLAICAYAIVPMIRYTRHGLTNTPDDLIEAAVSSGATQWQIMRDVRAPYAAPTILLGLNQTVLYAFAMLVIAALVGTSGLGQSIYLALGQADIGLGIAAGAAMAILAWISDRLIQGFAEERRKALGL